MKKKTVIILLILIIIVQVAFKIYMGNEKGYLHIDEGYSYGLMNYDKIEFTQNEDFYNTWHDNNYYLDYLSVNSDEVWDWSAVYENQKNDVHPPLFYFLLRVAASFTVDSFTKWTGITLNILFFIVAVVVLFLLSKEIFKNPVYALITCLVSGFSLASIESTIFIRMYELSALTLLIITYLHVRNFKKDLNITNLILIGVFSVIGALTHYYFIIFLGILYIIYMITYWIKKDKKNAIKYTLTMVAAGIVTLVIFPYLINHMFFGYRGQGIIQSFTDIQGLLMHLGVYIYILQTTVFNNLLVVIAAIALICIIAIFVKNGKITISCNNKKLLLVLVPTLVYFILVAAASPYQELRYIIPIYPMIILCSIYLMKKIFEKLLPEKNSLILICALAVLIVMSATLAGSNNGIMKIITDKYPAAASYVGPKRWYLYDNLNNFVDKVEKDYSKLPTLYVFEENHNRFLDDIYIFTKIDNSYIMNSKDFSTENLKKVFADKNTANGILVFINGGQENDDLLKDITKTLGLNKTEYFQRLNACDVYICK